MKYYFITHIESLSPLLDFNIDKANIDLHNDFVCNDIIHNGQNIEFYFKRTVEDLLYSEQNAVIIFSKIIESNFNVVQIGSGMTLMNFAKGEIGEGSEYNGHLDVFYFFIEFLESKMIDIVCKEANIFLW